ncbi:MAG: N-acetylmuramoyl-L-alanine amidase [Ferruginibacter sp.]
MLPFALYLLKVTICSGILFGYYWFMLRNKIFNQYNRFYLLAVVVLSIALPLIEINIWHYADQPSQSIKLLQVVNSSEYLDEIVVMAKQTDFTAEQVMFVFYSITSLVFLGLFLQALIKIRRLFVRHRHSLVDNIYFVNTTAKGTPFSFLKYIFWNDHIDPESPTGHQIFKHELAHVQQKHTYDKLFLNTVLIFLWCNPFFWLMRKELNMIHEFMADKIAVEDSDTEAFAAMILQASYPQHRFNLSNPFFYSPIKRRLMMLTKNRNTKVGYIGRLMVLPLMVLVFAAFTFKAKTFQQANQIYHGKTITVVIDAGHGGSDAGGQSMQGKILEKDLNLALTKTIQALNNNDKIKIVLTRETDITQTVIEKANFTKEANADLFISIHMESYPSTTDKPRRGLNVYVGKNNAASITNSQLFASVLINEFSNKYELPVNPQPLQRLSTIRVLQDALCPAVLIEPGNINDNKDLDYLQSDAGKKSIAAKILSAVEHWAVAREKEEARQTDVPVPTTDAAVATKKRDTMPTITLKNHERALIIVDGKTISNNELKNIKAETIESVRVVKDKVGIEKYGEKGKNGVVIITSKTATTASIDGSVLIRQMDSAAKNGDQVSVVNIRINGKKDSTIKALYVVDGNIKTNSFDIQTIAPADIQSITVLKGAAAEQQYGEAGVNGVIEITTKINKALPKVSVTPIPESNKIEVVKYGIK